MGGTRGEGGLLLVLHFINPYRSPRDTILHSEFWLFWSITFGSVRTWHSLTHTHSRARCCWLSLVVYRLRSKMATPHDGDPGHSLRAFDISMIVIPTVAVGLRFWSRMIHKTQNRSRLGWDDWIILMALVCFTGSCARTRFCADFLTRREAIQYHFQCSSHLCCLTWPRQTFSLVAEGEFDADFEGSLGNLFHGRRGNIVTKGVSTSVLCPGFLHTEPCFSTWALGWSCAEFPMVGCINCALRSLLFACGKILEH